MSFNKSKSSYSRTGCIFDTSTRVRLQENSNSLCSGSAELQQQNGRFGYLGARSPGHSYPLAAGVPGLRQMSASAGAATRAELQMTLIRGSRLYPRAIIWSLLLSSTVIMEGYDTSLMKAFFGIPVFREFYGKPVNPDRPPEHRIYEISPAWQSGLTSSAFVGQIIGLLINGFIADQFGYRRTMVGALIGLCLFVVLAFLSINIFMLLAADFLCGESLPSSEFQLG
jgi:hypothetical protein